MQNSPLKHSAWLMCHIFLVSQSCRQGFCQPGGSRHTLGNCAAKPTTGAKSQRQSFLASGHLRYDVAVTRLDFQLVWNHLKRAAVLFHSPLQSRGLWGGNKRFAQCLLENALLSAVLLEAMADYFWWCVMVGSKLHLHQLGPWFFCNPVKRLRPAGGGGRGGRAPGSGQRLHNQDIRLKTALYLWVSVTITSPRDVLGCPGLHPPSGRKNSQVAPSTAVREACLSVQFCTEGWQCRGKLCCDEDALLVLAAADNLPILDKQEQQQRWH